MNLSRKRTKILYGKKKLKKDYKQIPLEEVVGKTVEAIGWTTVESSYGDEPCIVFFFTDGTHHGFVLPGGS